ncbi:MAG: phosphoribosylaminoimidazolesuccinocarboxamide synthase [Methanomassiliicoccales archaeon]|jgi:phosphoribosylaminoimidazole-succinocarboxamide synthase|nr:phosphoribosylaminoimidazolesuccinocarboxamide synthase [Methanomassiliicoccales archaeon]
MKLLRVGKVKQVYEVDENTLEFVFTDNISVFDKIIPTQIPYKGETLCRTAVFWFQVLKKNGIRTHFKEFVPPNRMRVRKVDVISDYSKLNCNSTNYLIPLEFISRSYVAGSLYDRIRSGKIVPEELGFPPNHNVSYGEKLPKPYFEVTTKLEKYDRELSRKEALDISGLTEEEFERILEIITKIDEIIAAEAEERMLIHVDGKKEFAFDEKRRLMVVDTFGTADEDRWWDQDAYAVGKFIELSKEAVRQYYREIGYYDKLMEARRKGLPEPDIPPLPKNKIEEISDLYIEMFEKITGESFR